MCREAGFRCTMMTLERSNAKLGLVARNPIGGWGDRRKSSEFGHVCARLPLC